MILNPVCLLLQGQYHTTYCQYISSYMYILVYPPTGYGHRMPYRKWKENNQQLSRKKQYSMKYENTLSRT